MSKGSFERPFDSFKELYQFLIYIGICEPLNLKNRFLVFCSKFYRCVVFSCIVLYSLQHLAYTIMVRDNLYAMTEGFFMSIPQLNFVLKIAVINVYGTKLKKVHAVLNDSVFAAQNAAEEQILVDNRKITSLLRRLANIGTTVSAVSWIAGPLLRRMTDSNASIASLFPFDYSPWPKFILAVFLETGPVAWVGYGHVYCDCLIAIYYAQARAQLQIVQHKLKNVFNTLEGASNTFQYLDHIDGDVKKRFLLCIKRYDRVVWYIQEVDHVFNKAMLFQFFTTSSMICALIYRMSHTDMISFQFVFFVGILITFFGQIFLYCLFGTLVEYESSSINDSVYQSGWVSLSPSCRRLLLIAMSRWTRPVTPRAAYFVPLSLDTFLTIVRSAYSLYTVLISTTYNIRD